PLGRYNFLLSRFRCGSVENPQSTADRWRLPYAAGILSFMLLLRPPASNSSTLWAGFSESRFANTHPAEPAPIMIKSNFVIRLKIMVQFSFNSRKSNFGDVL